MATHAEVKQRRHGARLVKFGGKNKRESEQRLAGTTCGHFVQGGKHREVDSSKEHAFRT